MLRRLPPEFSHALALKLLRSAQGLRLLSAFADVPPDDPVECFGLRFANRLGIAAGMDKNADCIDALGALGAGFVEVGTVTPRPCPGNAGRRLRRLPAQKAVVNRLGFPNKGLAHVKRRLQRRRWRGIVGVNIGKQPDTAVGEAVEDFLLLMRELWLLADYFTINISSPNSPGLTSLQQKRHLLPLLRQLLDESRKLQRRHGMARPLLLKLSADLQLKQMRDIASALKEAPMAGVVLTNTSREHSYGEGGISGPPLAQRAQAALSHFSDLLAGQPTVLVACGGIDSGKEAVRRRDAGAQLLQMYTALVYDGPALLGEIGRALTAEQTD